MPTHSPLTVLRQNAPVVTARRFLQWNAASHIQYFDDTPAKNPLKALAARTFDPEIARRKQREQCAVTFSLQAFGDTRTKQDLYCFHTLGVDVDLIAPPARATMPASMIDARKDDYLRRILLPFPLKPQWVIETRHGLHLLFRIHPQREPTGVNDALELNRRLVSVLRGDPNAVLLTQLFRVPGTLQFKVPEHPFLCRLLLDHSADIDPYPLSVVRKVLNLWEPVAKQEVPPSPRSTHHAEHAPRWLAGLRGVSEGERNATAASLIGKIIRQMPEELWETAGWGGLKEWNRSNPKPLLERELRAVFESIARREQRKRREWHRPASSPLSPPDHAEQ